MVNNQMVNNQIASRKKSIYSSLLSLTTILSLSCTYKNYPGEAGIRHSFPQPSCGTVTGTFRGYSAQVNPNIDEHLFAEFGYCLPPFLREHIAFAASYYHGSFLFQPLSTRYEKGSITTWEVAVDAPAIPSDPRAWLYALQDADNNGDGWIYPEETEKLESYIRGLMWKEQVKVGHRCQETRFAYGKGGKSTYEQNVQRHETVKLRQCPYKPASRDR